MAIIKSMTLANFTTGNYWRITNLTLDKRANVLQVGMDLYVSEAAAKNNPAGGLGNNKWFSFPVTKSEMNSSGDELVALAYQKIINFNARDEVKDKDGKVTTTAGFIDEDFGGGVQG